MNVHKYVSMLRIYIVCCDGIGNKCRSVQNFGFASIYNDLAT